MRRGRAVQVDPIKLTFKAHGSERLKLEHGKPLSSFAFKFNLRRYSVGPALYTYYDALHVRQSKERTCRHQCPKHPLITPRSLPTHR
jgi:hypothetical protein